MTVRDVFYVLWEDHTVISVQGLWRLWYLWKGWWKFPSCITRLQLLKGREQFVQAGDGLGGRAWIRLWSQRVLQSVHPLFSWDFCGGSDRILLSLSLARSKAYLLHAPKCVLVCPWGLPVCGRCAHLSGSAEGSVMPWFRAWSETEQWIEEVHDFLHFCDI